MSPALVFVLVLAAAPALANHPGERLDEVTAAGEPAFEAAGQQYLPDADFRTAGGAPAALDAWADRIVVLSFVAEGCGAPCADQQALLVGAQEGIDVTPMRELVSFVTVAPEGAPPAGGWDPVNWTALVPPPQETAASLADRFAALSTRAATEPMAFVIDRDGRLAGIFHGAGFNRLNLILYVNGLSNAHPPRPGLLERVLGMFR